MLAFAAPPARAVEILADEPAPDDWPGVVLRRTTLGLPLRVGVFAGWHATAGDFDVLGERVTANRPSPGPAFGLRLGWRITPGWGLELSGAAIPAGSEWLVPIIAELRWRPIEALATWSPTLALGAGSYVGIGAGGDADLLLSAMTGFEVKLSREVAVRLEGGVWVTDAVSGPLAWTPVVVAGIDLMAWRDRTVAVERDPEPRPVRIVRGCPAGVAVERCRDGDDDGVIDAFDACPVVAGTVGGCPDDDGDGVVAPRDACPLRRGAGVDWGCPR